MGIVSREMMFTHREMGLTKRKTRVTPRETRRVTQNETGRVTHKDTGRSVAKREMGVHAKRDERSCRERRDQAKRGMCLVPALHLQGSPLRNSSPLLFTLLYS